MATSLAGAIVLAAALGAGCNGNKAPHGSPILRKVYWQVGTQQFPIWSIDQPDGGAPGPVPAAASQFNLVFDRVLDGSKIEDTVTINGVSGPQAKANPPVMVSWPGMDTAVSEPPFGLSVWYNSVPLINEPAGSAYVYGREVPSYPSDTAITITLDETRITSQYDEPMTGPSSFLVMTEPFSLLGVEPPGGAGGGADAGDDAGAANTDSQDAGDDTGDGGDGGRVPDELPHGRQAPVNYWVSLHFNNLPAAAAVIRPYIHVTSNGAPYDTFKLVSDPDDPTRVHLQPFVIHDPTLTDPKPVAMTRWDEGARIDVTIDPGLPDVFGKPLVTPASASFIACSACADGGVAGDASGATSDDASDDTSDDAAADAAVTDGTDSPDGGADAPASDDASSD